MKRTKKAVLIASTRIAGNRGSGSERFDGDLDEKLDGTPSAKASVSKAFADTSEENAFKEAPARCVLA